MDGETKLIIILSGAHHIKFFFYESMKGKILK
jgi:hypothetical protein